MTPLQIEGMIDRVVGMYPTAQVGRNTMKNTWTQDKFLLEQSVEDVRRVLPLIEAHNRIPSLPEIKTLLRMLYKNDQVNSVGDECCLQCGGCGWVNGFTVSDAEMLNGKWIKLGVILTERFVERFCDRQYTVVKRCQICDGSGTQS